VRSSTKPRAVRARRPGRLRFDGELEDRFAEYFVARALPTARFALLLAVALFALFGILDGLLVPEEAGTIWGIRFAFVCPLGLAVYGFTFTRAFRTVMQPTLCAFAVLGGLSIVAMIVIADPPAGYLYYAGLVLVIFWTYTLLQLHFVYATVATLAIVAGYEIGAIWFTDTPVDIMVSNNFFFVTAAVLGAAAGYGIERGIRTGFEQRRTIEEQRSELALHNRELDAALRASLDEVRRQAQELQASRTRIVVAGDVERRRIERNLHDGAQQQLVALAVKLGVARSRAGNDEDLQVLLAQLKCDADEALETLRDLARGIYPPLLADQGLVAALGAQARKSPIPVAVSAEGIERYPSEVEAAVYFSVLEALQNVTKYARATRASVVLTCSEGSLSFEVGDDGVGFDPTTVSRGIGLQSMADRIEALGGSLVVASEPGAGSVVSGSVPVSSEVAPQR
jgi:signal transduction histidine kinase